MSPKAEQRLLYFMKELLKNGFSINESLAFITKLEGPEKSAAVALLRELEKGAPLAEGFKTVGASKGLQTQIALAEIHGDFLGTITISEKTHRMLEKQKKQLFKVALYPCILLLFLLGMLLVMQVYLLPQLLEMQEGKKSWSFAFFEALPQIILLTALGFLLAAFLGKRFMSRWPVYRRTLFLIHLPIVGKCYREYLSAYFSRELGKLFAQGLEMKKILQVLAAEATLPVMKAWAEEVAEDTAKGLETLKTFDRWEFFNAEMGHIANTSSMSGHLGEELLLYSEMCWERLMQRFEKMIHLIQPLVFLFIACMILLLYSALLLPIYNTSWGDM